MLALVEWQRALFLSWYAEHLYMWCKDELCVSDLVWELGFGQRSTVNVAIRWACAGVKQNIVGYDLQTSVEAPMRI